VKFGIAAKINFFTTILVIFSNIFLGWFFIRHETRAIRLELDKRAQTIVNNLAYNSEYGVLVEDKDVLNRLIAGVIKERDVAYAIIENKKGEIIVQAGRKRRSLIKEYKAQVFVKPLLESLDEFSLPSGSKPKQEKEVIGTIYLGISLSNLYSKSIQIRRVIISIVIIVMIISTLMLFIVVRLFIHEPLNLLISGTEKIGKGDLSHRVKIKSKDEIGKLANSFNLMTEDLHKDITERELARKRQAHLLKQLESAHKELKNFSYISAHDLKTPLRNISTLVNWLATDYGDKFDEDGKEKISLLENRVKRMYYLLDGILLYSEIGMDKAKEVRIDLNQTIKNVLENINPPDNINIFIEKKLPVILFDRKYIEIIFHNLLSNAVQFIDKPKGEINVTFTEDSDFWKFSITDNGMGINEKYFTKIFRIFQTLKARDECERTGIGLSLVKKIVEMNGGSIKVSSEGGKGSTFMVLLPKKKKKH